MKKRPVFEPLKDDVPVDALYHLGRLMTGRIEAEVHQHHEAVKRGKQSLIVTPPTPGTIASLTSQKLRTPALGRHSSALDCHLLGLCVSKVPHHLPSNRRVRIEQPLK